MLHAAELREPLVERAIEGADGRAIAVAGTRWGDVEGDDVIDRDAGVAPFEEQQVLHHQAGADQQRERDGDLADHETIAEGSPAAGGPRVSFPQRRGQGLQLQPEERGEPADQTDENRRGGRECQHARVDVNRRRTWKIVRGEHDEHAHDPDREQQAERSSREGQDQRLARQLARDVCPVRPERQPDGDFPPP